MYPDFKELLSLFNARKVKYLIVGGYAVSFHSQPRATKDLDILVKTDARNSRALYMALAEYGAPLQGYTPDDFAQQGTFFTIGIPPVRVDILTAIDGVTFDRCWRKKAKVKVDKNLSAYMISEEDLILNKLASGRLQDIADVAALRMAGSVSSRRLKTPRKSSARKKRGK